MFSQLMIDYGNKPNIIRDISGAAQKRKAEIGAENVHDFTIGAPNIPAPPEFHAAILDIIANTDPVALHTYTPAQGSAELRSTIAAYINRRFGDHVTPDGVFVTHGASSALATAIKALTLPGDEVILFVPYYMEYKIYAEGFETKCVLVPTAPETLQIDAAAFEKAVTPKTKVVIVNSPNNPSGVAYTDASLRALTDVMKKKEAEYGHPIFLLADEPYRELVYDGIQVPYLMNYYDDVVNTYSYSKSLSIPGERMGYVAVCKRCAGYAELVPAIAGAARLLGHICASNLMQRVITRCIDVVADVSYYKRNRDLLYTALSEMGYACVHPDGAFYMFIKSPTPDSLDFCNAAKAQELFLVPGHDFGIKDYLRISYCVEYEAIERALPAFRALAEKYGLKK